MSRLKWAGHVGNMEDKQLAKRAGGEKKAKKTENAIGGLH